MNYDALCLGLAYKELNINGIEEISDEEAHRLYEAGGHCNWPGGNEDRLIAEKDRVIADHKALRNAQDDAFIDAPERKSGRGRH